MTPIIEAQGGHAYPTPIVVAEPGTSLRDWFAGQALAGMIELRDLQLAILRREDTKIVREPMLAIASAE